MLEYDAVLAGFRNEQGEQNQLDHTAAEWYHKYLDVATHPQLTPAGRVLAGMLAGKLSGARMAKHIANRLGPRDLLAPYVDAVEQAKECLEDKSRLSRRYR